MLHGESPVTHRLDGSQQATAPSRRRAADRAQAALGFSRPSFQLARRCRAMWRVFGHGFLFGSMHVPVGYRVVLGMPFTSRPSSVTICPCSFR